MARFSIRYSAAVSDFRLPSLTDIMRMPAGDRELRLRALIQRHRNALAAIEPGMKDRASQYRRTGHTRALAILNELAQHLSVKKP
jgi:hypothetical protein